MVLQTGQILGHCYQLLAQRDVDLLSSARMPLGEK